MKRCFKCVSNQKCSTGNLQSLWGRCEMCSPCHFCHDRSTLHGLRCQIPPPSRYSSSHALDCAVRKPRETLLLWLAPWPTHWPQEGFINKNPTCVHHLGKLPEYSGFIGGKRKDMSENEGAKVGKGEREKNREQRNRSILIVTTDMMNDSRCVKNLTGYYVRFHKFPLLCGSVFFISCENNLFWITSWISSSAPMTSQGLSGLSLCVSVFCLCLCVCTA